MPLNVDLSALHAAVERMGARDRDFTVGDGAVLPLDPIDVRLERGIELPDLKEVETSSGLLSFKGRQILLYIQDQGSKILEVLEKGQAGKKFHVADCKTLKTMRARGRFERYVVTNKLDGEFYVTGVDSETGEGMEGDARLWVCQNCLKALNYKGAQQRNAYGVAAAFSIEEFFATYSSFFTHLPSRKAGNQEDEGYTADWTQVAARYKAERNFQCESCRVDLTNQKNLLHVHHRNGVKSDNTASNLQALCVACHREQPHHEHLFVPHKDTRRINHLRREQGLLGGGGRWDEVLEYCDPGLKGLVQALRSAGAPPPEVGFDIQDRSQAVVANLELAWPRTKQGVVIADDDRKAASAQGWKVWSMFHALDKIDRFVEETRR